MIGWDMVDRPTTEEAEFLRERAATLLNIASTMPPSVAAQLMEVAAQLEKRAAKFGPDPKGSWTRDD
jgi:hypothetical protein